ncbi:hypothetical protein RF11_13513 [Thelohanellus kitauei]|uniref:Uncharacterized protein n=1 Tax=Thelohanellus kitauei TaxID=669202 RepID=A0A0C2IZI0_THEKT|nr:hypothetical protein RF11_13513 [Thelohanellus kitauei]
MKLKGVGQYLPDPNLKTRVLNGLCPFTGGFKVCNFGSLSDESTTKWIGKTGRKFCHLGPPILKYHRCLLINKNSISFRINSRGEARLITCFLISNGVRFVTMSTCDQTKISNTQKHKVTQKLRKHLVWMNLWFGDGVKLKKLAVLTIFDEDVTYKTATSSLART